MHIKKHATNGIHIKLNLSIMAVSNTNGTQGFNGVSLVPKQHKRHPECPWFLSNTNGTQSVPGSYATQTAPRDSMECTWFACLGHLHEPKPPGRQFACHEPMLYTSSLNDASAAWKGRRASEERISGSIFNRVRLYYRCNPAHWIACWRCVCVCVHVCACVCMCVHVCVCMCICVCMCVCLSLKNMLPTNLSELKAPSVSI